MAQYAKLAQKVGPALIGTSQKLTAQMFQRPVGVVIYRDEVHEKYGSDVSSSRVCRIRNLR